MPATTDSNALCLAETVRSACLAAALEGYQRARMDGLCDEGALEVALDAVRSLDLARVLKEAGAATGEDSAYAG